jgi:8-oxo-dGTP diphosphatase
VSEAPVSVVAAVLRRDGKYLLGQRPAHKRHGGLWEFPGGKLLHGESRLDAARRELEEELGLEVTEVGALLGSVRDPAAPFVIDFVEVVALGEPIAREHSRIDWLTASQLGDLELAPADATFARQLGARRRDGP